MSSLPVGAVTVSNDLVFTALSNGTLIALNRATGAIVYRQALPTTTNAPLAVFGDTVLVPVGGPETSANRGGGEPQLVDYTVSSQRSLSASSAGPTDGRTCGARLGGGRLHRDRHIHPSAPSDRPNFTARCRPRSPLAPGTDPSPDPAASPRATRPYRPPPAREKPAYGPSDWTHRLPRQDR